MRSVHSASHNSKRVFTVSNIPLCLRLSESCVFTFTELQIWPDKVTDRTIQRIAMQGSFTDAYGQKIKQRGLFFCVLTVYLCTLVQQAVFETLSCGCIWDKT